MKSIKLILMLMLLYNGNCYSPPKCTPINYDFTFLYDHSSGVFKVHGCWPEICKECTKCGYPQCCNGNKSTYTPPYDPNNWIEQYWYNSTTKNDCTGEHNISLFHHEYDKHISCSEIGNTTSFLNLIMQLYDKYYDNYVKDKCNSSEQLWINMDANFNYIKTTCK